MNLVTGFGTGRTANAWRKYALGLLGCVLPRIRRVVGLGDDDASRTL